MSDPVPTTSMRCAVGCEHSTWGVDVGYSLGTVRGDAAHPVSRGLACGRWISETVAVRTPRARIVARVDADEAIPEGLIWLPSHHPATNRLTHPAVNPKSKEPNFKQCAVRLAPPPLNAAGGVDAETGESEPPLGGVDPR